MDRLRKCYPHQLGSFLARKASLALSGCLPSKDADYCILVNEWVWLRSQVCLLSLKVYLGSVLESELRQKIRYDVLKCNFFDQTPCLLVLWLLFKDDYLFEGGVYFFRIRYIQAVQ